MNKITTDSATPIADEVLDTVQGGLPAVQAARETARLTAAATPTVKAGDGSVKPGGDVSYEAFPC